MRRLLSHICVILSLVTLTFLVLNQFNPSIFGKVFFHIELLVYAVAVLLLSFPIILRGGRKNQHRQERGNPAGTQGGSKVRK